MAGEESTEGERRTQSSIREPMKAAELPKAPDAERAVCGAMFRWPGAVGALCAELGLTAAIFTDLAPRLIFGYQAESWAAGVELDEVGVIEKLRASGNLQAIGGIPFVLGLQSYAPSSTVIRTHCETIQGKAILRGVMSACTDYHARAAGQDEDPVLLAQSVSSTMTDLICGMRKEAAKTVKQLIQEKIERMQDGEPDKDVLLTGLTDLDRVSPIRLGSVPLLTGERKAGKSIFAITVTANLLRAGRRVLYFTLEDPGANVLDRITANLSRTPIARQHIKVITEGESMRVYSALKDLATYPLTIRDDTYDISGIQAVTRQEKAKHPDLACVVIDYAQLVRAQVSKGANREVEVATVSRAVRLLAMELKVVIILLCQINKEGEARESKALEQDCTAMWKVRACEEAGERDLEIPFQRDGESAILLKFTFRGEISRFENYIRPA
jgi:replicative DNA helicase